MIFIEINFELFVWVCYVVSVVCVYVYISMYFDGLFDLNWFVEVVCLLLYYWQCVYCVLYGELIVLMVWWMWIVWVFEDLVCIMWLFDEIVWWVGYGLIYVFVWVFCDMYGVLFVQYWCIGSYWLIYLLQ